MERRAVLWAGTAVLILALLAPLAWGQEPVVRALFFYSRDCPHCLAVQQKVIPAPQDRFGSQLDLRQLEISDPAVYRLLLEMLEMEEAYGVPPEEATIPELFVGKDALLGEAAIRQEAADLVEQYLQAGGADWPAPYASYMESAPLQAETPTPAPAPTRHLCPTCAEEPPVRTDAPVVHFYYFGDRRCGTCLALDREFLRPLEQAYGERVRVDRRDLEGSAQDYTLFQTLEAAYGVTESRLPQVYIGKYALVGEQEMRERLQEHIDTYLALGGVDLPAVPTATAPPASPTPTPEPATASAWPSPGLPLAGAGVAAIAAIALALGLRGRRTVAT